MTPGTDSARTAKRVPGATYRLQFNRDFTFSQAAAVADYLGELGVTDGYASPLFQPAPGSSHGYDMCDFNRFNPDLGGAEDFARFTATLRQLGIGLLLDFVPNHMSADPSNPWWRDVLENGRASAFAPFFDIHWGSAPGARDQVLLQVLENDYERELVNGKLRLVFEGGTFCLAYGGTTFPLAPESRAALERIRSTGRDVLDAFNGTAGSPGSFARLDDLLQQQHYRLAGWRVNVAQINYRRFFDVADLVALRMELPQVFAACHELVLRLIAAGQVTGLRIDHPDGLWDPGQYFERLRASCDRSVSCLTATAPGSGRPGFFVVAEKILSGDELLPDEWMVDGTTGYDFLNCVGGLFVDRVNRTAFDAIYREFTGVDGDFETAAYLGRKKILNTAFVGELEALVRRLDGLQANAGCARTFSTGELRAALAEVIANFPVYRTYVNERSGELQPADKAALERAVHAAKSRNAAAVPAVLDFVSAVSLRPVDGGSSSGAAREFVMRLQQLTAPVMAKGIEDTAFYNFNRLISLNEVGGNPARFGTDLAEFHAHNQTIAARWPHSLLATTTHDTKRGEDVRARINVLSEIPGEWQRAVRRWSEMNALNRRQVDGAAAPSRNDEYLLYQTLVGAWPIGPETAGGLKDFRERLGKYLIKAVREAKTRTSWREENTNYEDAVRGFAEALLSAESNSFLAEFRPFQRRVASFGQFNSLAQTLLKMTSPGVPDFYQGTELWDLNLVDPDNRRPVNYALRRRLLAELKEQSAQSAIRRADFARGLLGRTDAGSSKLYLIWRTLAFRNEHRDLFDRGSYVPLSASGEKKAHVVAFARRWRGRIAIAIAPRLVVGLADARECIPIGSEVWKDTRLELPDARAGETFRNVLTDETVEVVERDGVSALRLGDVLKSFPAALLSGERVQSASPKESQARGNQMKNVQC